MPFPLAHREVGGMITAPLLSMFVIPAAWYLMRRPRKGRQAVQLPIQSRGGGGGAR